MQQWIPLSVSAGINPIMTSIIGDMGAMAGRMSPLTPEAAVVRTLMEAQGLDGNTIPIMICTFITAVVVSILIAVYYKGWRVDNSYAGGTKAQLPSFSWQQILSLVGLSIMAVGALFLGWNVGLTGFLIGTVLVVLGCGDEKKAVSGVPCGVILMVLGVGMLMNICTSEILLPMSKTSHRVQSWQTLWTGRNSVRRSSLLCWRERRKPCCSGFSTQRMKSAALWPWKTLFWDFALG